MGRAGTSRGAARTPLPRVGGRAACRGGGGGSRRRRFRSARHWPLRCSRGFGGAAGAALVGPRRRPSSPARRPHRGWRRRPGLRGARGLLGGAVAGEGAGGWSNRPAARTGWRQAGRAEPGARPRRSERESKTEDQAVWPGQLCPRRARLCQASGYRGVRAGPRAAAVGREVAWWGPSCRRHGRPGGPRRLPASQRSALHHAGHRRGINFTTTVPSLGKSLHFAPQVAAAVPPLLPLPLRPRSRVGAGPRPLLRPSPARGLPPLRPAGGRQRRCSSAHYFKSPEYDLTRTESHSERERERASGEEKVALPFRQLFANFHFSLPSTPGPPPPPPSPAPTARLGFPGPSA